MLHRYTLTPQYPRREYCRFSGVDPCPSPAKAFILAFIHVNPQPLIFSSRLLTEDRCMLCSLKVKKQMNGSSGQMLMWTSAAQTAVQRRPTVMPPSTQWLGVQRGGPEPVLSGVPEEKAQPRGQGQIVLISEHSELESAAGCRRAGMLRMTLMKKTTQKSLRRCWCLFFPCVLLTTLVKQSSAMQCNASACHHSHSIHSLSPPAEVSVLTCAHLVHPDSDQ